MADTDVSLLIDLLGKLQEDVSDLRAEVAGLKIKVGWVAGLLTMIGGAGPVGVTLLIHLLSK